jgi:hypothetical protein
LGDKPLVSIAATDPAAVEGTSNGTIVFKVTQTNLSTVDTTVLVKGTLDAITAADVASITYTDATTGQPVTLSSPAQIASFFTTGVNVKIPAGSLSAPVITFTAVDDTVFEQSENFSVGISDAVNATVDTASASASATIFDNFSDADESVRTNEDTPVSGNVIDSLSGVLSVTNFTISGVPGTFTAGNIATTIPNKGSITIGTNGAYTFTPVANWSGVVPTITYTISAGSGATETSTLDITVIPVNDNPVAVSDHYTMLADGGEITLTPKTLSADSDTDGDTLSVTNINGTPLTPGTAQTITVTNGIVNVAADGTLTFTPDIGFTGTVTFPYVISDGNGGTATANEIIDVTPVPVINAALPVYNFVPPLPPISPRPTDNKPAPVTHHNNERFIEKRPIELGQYKFHTVVLNFNGQFGGINQFSPPTVESTLVRDDLEYSNQTPYYPFDRVIDAVKNAQRSVDAKLAVTHDNAFGLNGAKFGSDLMISALGSKATEAAKFGRPEAWAKAYAKSVKDGEKYAENAKAPALAEKMRIGDKDSHIGNKTKLALSKKAGFVGKSSLANQIQTVMSLKTG